MRREGQAYRRRWCETAGAFAIGVIVVFAMASNSYALPAVVSGQTFNVRSCYAGTFDRALSGLDWFGHAGYLADLTRCPDQGIGFGDSNDQIPVLPGTKTYFEYQLKRNVAVTGIRMRVSGGDTSNGIRYLLKPCDNCDPFADLGERGDDAPDGELVSFPVPDTNGLAFAAGCTNSSDPCTTSRALFARNIQLTMSDTTEPMVSDYSGLPDQGVPIEEIPWFRPGDLRYRGAVLDAGTGLFSASMEVDQSTVWSSTSECRYPMRSWLYDDEIGWYEEDEEWFESAEICPQSASFDGILDFNALSDGVHTVRMGGVDAAGNSGLGSAKVFGVDTTPPEEPEGLKARTVGGEVDRWTQDASVKLNWDDPRSNWGASGSPYSAAWFDVRSPSGQMTGPSTKYLRETDWLGLGADGLWRFRVWFEDAAGNTGDRRAVIVGLDRDPPVAPELDELPWLSPARLVDGAALTWGQPADSDANESGRCGYRIDIDGRQSVDIPSSARSFEFPALGEGIRDLRIQAISCAGLLSDPESVPVRVDGTPPTPIFSGPANNVWSSTGQHVELGATDQLSGVEKIRFKLDEDPEVEVAGSRASLDLDDGDHMIHFAAIDRAGNVSATVSKRALVDAEAPSALFQPIDPRDPVSVTAVIEDKYSGIDSGWIEMRRVGANEAPDEAGTWHLIGNVTHPNPDESKRLLVRAEVPETSLPDGEYELRAVAIDQAGNAAYGTGVLPLGAPMRLRLPLRAKPRLSAGVGEIKRGKLVVAGSSSRRVLAFARTPAIVGRLVYSSGEPIAGAAVDVRERSDGADKADLLGTVFTDGDGRYSLSLRPGPNRAISVTYRGSKTAAPTTAEARLFTRAGITLTASRRAVRERGHIVLRGRLLGDISDIPDGGKLVILQYWSGKRWQPAIDSPYSNSRGSFRVSWPVGRVTKPTRVLIRAMVPGQGWPYLSGYSRVLSVRVLP